MDGEDGGRAGGCCRGVAKGEIRHLPDVGPDTTHPPSLDDWREWKDQLVVDSGESTKLDCLEWWDCCLLLLLLWHIMY